MSLLPAAVVATVFLNISFIPVEELDEILNSYVVSDTRPDTVTLNS